MNIPWCFRWFSLRCQWSENEKQENCLQKITSVPFTRCVYIFWLKLHSPGDTQLNIKRKREKHYHQSPFSILCHHWNPVRNSQNPQLLFVHQPKIYLVSSAGADAAGASSGLASVTLASSFAGADSSASPDSLEVQRVKLSRRSCMMRVESR